MTRLAIVVLFIALGSMPGSVAAGIATLLEHVGTDAKTERRVDSGLAPHELRSSLARVNLHSLNAGQGTGHAAGQARPGAPALLLNLFRDDPPIEARIVDVERRSPDDFTVYGSIPDDPRSLVLLTAVNGFVAGTILHHDRMYRLKPARSGLVRVVEVDRNSFNDLGDDVDRPVFPPQPPNLDRRFDAFDHPWFKDSFRVDVLAAYTLQVLFAYGSGGMDAFIQHNIDMTNINLYASGIVARLRLVHTEFEAYDESWNYPYRHIINNVLDDLKTQNDGLLDGVHTQRDLHSADIVVLFAKWNDGCGSYRFRLPPNQPDYGGPAGRAPINFKNPLPSSTNGFAVVDVDCAIADLVFSHEVGHILGADHDADASSPPISPTDYARGFVYIVPSVMTRSIMSYSTACDKLQLSCPVGMQYSNPDIYPYGVPFGSPTKADNRRIINELTWYIAGFR